MKRKPDDRRDNVEKIQQNIDNTVENIRITEDRMALTDDPKSRQPLEEKNERRADALDSMKNEIKDEANDRRRGYK